MQLLGEGVALAPRFLTPRGEGRFCVGLGLAGPASYHFSLSFVSCALWHGCGLIRERVALKSIRLRGLVTGTWARGLCLSLRSLYCGEMIGG